MTRTWKTLRLTAALVGLLMTDGRGAAQPAGPAPNDPRQDLEQLRDETIRSFQAAKKEIDGLKEDVARLRKDLDDLRNAASPPHVAGDAPPEAGAGDNGLAQAAREIDALKEQIARLRKNVEDLRAAKPPANRIAAYPPSGAAAGTGTIRLANTYSADVVIVVNGEAYTLAPGESRVLANRPAGTFTYEVVGVQPPVERTLIVNGTFPILVHP